MKDYKEVVNERFDRDAGDLGIYAPTHPIGRYIANKLFNELDKSIQLLGIDKTTAYAVDLGCGEGAVLEKLVSFGFREEQLLGVDLSSKRIEAAQKRLPGISFTTADIVHYDLDKKADLIVCFDVLSHLDKREDILSVLRAIHKNLNDGGAFIWYDIYSADHFSSPENADSWGFSKKQMIDLAQESGLHLVAEKSLFRNFFNRYHSVYQAKRLPHGLLSTLEKILPGSPGNLMLSFRKNA